MTLRLRRRALAVFCVFVALTHLPILAQRTSAQVQSAIAANRVPESIDESRAQELPDHLPR